MLTFEYASSPFIVLKVEITEERSDSIFFRSGRSSEDLDVPAAFPVRSLDALQPGLVVGVRLEPDRADTLANGRAI